MSGLLLGLDLGTTSLAGTLWDEDGQALASTQVDNPQQDLGADIIQRLEVANRGAGPELQRRLVYGINLLVRKLSGLARVKNGRIVSAAAAGNPAISHFLAGQSIGRILFPPHRPIYLAGESLDSEALNLDLPVPLTLLPLVSGFVGGDLLALLLGGPPAKKPSLYLDLGTNAEIALWDGQCWMATSVAAGPAFEAGNLSCGMRHTPGAVTRVGFANERLILEVCGDGSARGLCGSGLFSAINAALAAGLIATDGRIKKSTEIDSNLSRYLQPEEDAWNLQIYRDATRCLRICQEDVRAFQLAKGAVRAGIECLLQRAKLQPGQLEAVRIAGALGGALAVSDLKGVAMLPEIMLEKCRFHGAGVLDGLKVFLLEKTGPDRVDYLAKQLKTYPLSGTPVFEKAFLAALDFNQ